MGAEFTTASRALVWSEAQGRRRSRPLLMTQAALHAGHGPDRAGFVEALQITRRSLAQQGATAPG